MSAASAMPSPILRRRWPTISTRNSATRRRKAGSDQQSVVVLFAHVHGNRGIMQRLPGGQRVISFESVIVRHPLRARVLGLIRLQRYHVCHKASSTAQIVRMRSISCSGVRSISSAANSLGFNGCDPRTKRVSSSRTCGVPARASSSGMAFSATPKYSRSTAQAGQVHPGGCRRKRFHLSFARRQNRFLHRFTDCFPSKRLAWGYSTTSSRSWPRCLRRALLATLARLPKCVANRRRFRSYCGLYRRLQCLRRKLRQKLGVAESPWGLKIPWGVTPVPVRIRPRL